MGHMVTNQKDNLEMQDVLKDTNEILQKGQENAEEYREQLELARDNQKQQDYNRDLINDMIGDEDDDSELDEEFAMYEKMVAKGMQFDSANKQMGMNTNT